MPGLKPLLFRKLILGALAGSGFFLPLSGQTAVTLENLEYLSIRELATRFRMQSVWRVPEKEFQISGQWFSIEFTAASRAIRINGLRVFLGEPVLLHQGQLHVSRLDFVATLQPILMPQAFAPSGSLRTIVIDPGHGGRDDGTRSRALELREKHLTLAVALRLQRVLEAQGYRVVLTRTSDTYVPLEERSARAVAAGADLFVSIHFNAVDNPMVQGTETYILTPRTHRSTGQQTAAATDAAGNPGNEYDHWNTLLAFLVHRQLLHDLGTFDRGIKRARFQVLRGVECPAVLVEAGYLSNPGEARGIATGAYQDNLVNSLVRAINQYRQTTENIVAARR